MSAKNHDDAHGVIVDELVRQTVRSVLFPALRGRSKGEQTTPSQSASRILEQDALATNGPLNQPPLESLPMLASTQVEMDVHAQSMRYASWSVSQLQDEKRRLKKRWRLTRKAWQQENPEEDDVDGQFPGASGSEETAIVEAYALVKLFLSERQQNSNNKEKEGGVAGVLNERVLHAQLDLFAKCFEETQGRKISQEQDILPVQRMYNVFLHS